MAKITDQKLLNLITYAPASIVGSFTMLWIALAVTDVLLSSKQRLVALNEEYQQQQNELLIKQVDYVAQQIKFAREQTEQQLKNTIQKRVYEAHSIATRLYQNNKHLPESQVTKMITDALRDIRFNDGRGYFFIYKTDGLNVMHPLLPRVEGTSLWDFKDVRGSYIVREMGEQVKQRGEAFYRWWFVKPDNTNHEFEKIGFGKHFVPYDWFIGTGDYIIDVENDIKQTVLKWINNLRFGEFGYIFVLDEDGTILSDIDERLIGRNALSLGDSENIDGVKRILTTHNQLVSYKSTYLPPGLSNYNKSSYVIKEPDWNWSIGSGIYDETNQRFIAERQKQDEESHRHAVTQMITIGIVTTFIVALFSLILSRLIASRFERFQSKINSDFNQLQQTKDKLEHMALHDELTGLPNRSLLHERILEGINLSTEQHQQLAVMFVDLDDFKKVNDLYGHTAGDLLLTKLGKKFEEFLLPHEFVARFGGDEFIFCFPSLNSLAETEKRVELIKNVFKQQFVIDNKVIYASCSIGVSMFPNDGDHPEDLIAKADIVLYKSKARQKGDVLFFDNNINQQVQYDFLLERELRRAIACDELSVVYQPQIDAKTNAIVGVESLLRWHNSQLGHVSPLEFITLAEEIGLINELGNFVLERACQEISEIFPHGEIILSVNISPMQLINETFISKLLSVTGRYQISPEHLTLEITENVLINDLPKVTPIITQIKELGFTISLDDFGTGYSSLSYLSHLPLDELKIDRVFIDKMLSSEQSNSLVKAILAIAKSANMRVVAEGVETEAQKNLLVEYQCDLLQGYFIERPLSAETLAKKYSKNSASSNK